MSKEAAFSVFCLENYKAYKSLTGKQTAELFRQYGVFDYLKRVLRCSSHNGLSVYQPRY